MCEPCLADYFAEKSGSSRCYRCRPGRSTWGEPGKSLCLQCDAGKYLNRSTDTCEECELGEIAGKPGLTSCTKCEEGKTSFQSYCKCCYLEVRGALPENKIAIPQK